MANLEKMTAQYVEEGYSELLAEARVCQDIVLKAISESTMNRNVTIKGGVVMRSITGDVRRATRDIDFDFIKYSIDEQAIREFIRKLNVLEGISLQISGDVEEGYSELLAEARVCQDIVLKAISESTMNRNVTIKGGVVISVIFRNM